MGVILILNDKTDSSKPPAPLLEPTTHEHPTEL